MRLNIETILKMKGGFLADYIPYIQQKGYEEDFELLEDKCVRIIGSHIFVADSLQNLNKEGMRISLGELVPLSDFNQRSVAYHNVSTIVYEEFINKGRKLFNEFNAMLLQFDTIIRERKDCKIILTANNITNHHPLFTTLGIDKVREGYTTINHNQFKRLLILNYPANKVLAQSREENIVGWLGGLNNYNQMANENKNYDNVNNITSFDTSQMVPYCGIISKDIKLFV